MIADDTAAREILEEDRQAEVILKEFAKGDSVPRHEDAAANQYAIRNMMSSGCILTRASAVKGHKQKVVETTQKKKNFPRHALPLFNDPVSSPVIPKYLERAPINLPKHSLPGMAKV
jgi:hypothetical protein